MDTYYQLWLSVQNTGDRCTKKVGALCNGIRDIIVKTEMRVLCGGIKHAYIVGRKYTSGRLVSDGIANK
ncbi:hypothetical protein DPMN_013143 [Dreissena polymorpha]|uniref:Uncharacterized protein n=1 Tax=Dreissena polymorpha TaxID=45954 RepID=A0A9D4S1K7_DREPO|nr:hypothetical protein DPMN_013143 [Dreissena polymorpha]